ncbi:arginase family protein [Georgenia sp. 311]|uniref:arginase family protein n=1 Tax=Georgenia sp. 311 TaxID=2585134 RepID=UPI0011119FD8|nr:arginase family protein [Georgenia sp. 311]TNC20547.1 arginase family protein [Georgenia sp. 311]
MIALVSAPSNLGLRPPEPGAAPGAAKAPEALREAGLFAGFAALGAVEAGVVLPGRYRHEVRPGRVRNEEALVDHARRLADRIGQVLDRGHVPLVLGGDCSILLGGGLALRRRGRFGLVHVDGHTDFRHPGNSDAVASVAGEDLAAVVGLHWPAVADVEERSPYFRPGDTVHVGCRVDDEGHREASEVLADVVTAPEVMEDLPGSVARVRRGVAAAGRGYWLHVDLDVLHPGVMPAVDSPDGGGLSPERLVELLTALAPGAVGVQVTAFDPDLDAGGRYARLVTEILLAGLRELGAARTAGA